MMPSADARYLAVETIHHALKQQIFYLFDLKKRKVVRQLSSPRFSGLSLRGFDCARLVFVRFSQLYNPDRTDVLLYTWGEHEPSQQYLGSRLLDFDEGGGMTLSHPHFAEQSVHIDWVKGREGSPARASGEEGRALVRFPRAYPPSSTYFPWFEEFFRPHNVLPVRQVEYLECDHGLFMAYYCEKNEELSHYLAVVDKKSGDLEENLLLEHCLKGVGKNTFFALDHQVIFVTQQRRLNIYE